MNILNTESLLLRFLYKMTTHFFKQMISTQDWLLRCDNMKIQNFRGFSPPSWHPMPLRGQLSVRPTSPCSVTQAGGTATSSEITRGHRKVENEENHGLTDS